MDKDVISLAEKVKELFPKSFINAENELIVEPKNNVYFRLEDVKSELDFKCKLIAWLSRPSCKGVSEYWQKRILAGLNGLLGTTFSKEEVARIYTRLGNDVNRKLTIKFIESGYDMSTLV